MQWATPPSRLHFGIQTPRLIDGPTTVHDHPSVYPRFEFVNPLQTMFNNTDRSSTSLSELRADFRNGLVGHWQQVKFVYHASTFMELRLSAFAGLGALAEPV